MVNTLYLFSGWIFHKTLFVSSVIANLRVVSSRLSRFVSIKPKKCATSVYSSNYLKIDLVPFIHSGIIESTIYLPLRMKHI